MSKIFLIATIIAACTSAAAAQDAVRTDTHLAADVAEGIAKLRAYGDRFEDAIRLIEAEATKPEWGWASCSHEPTFVDFDLPES